MAYLTNGYYFYVTGLIPPHKDPAKTDSKIMDAYGIAISKWTRTRRKREGPANIHYLRYQRFYVIIASHGVNPFFAAEAKRLRDIRRRPISFTGYSIGCRRARGGGEYHASVRINRERFAQSSSGLELLPWSALRLRRSPVRPFAEADLEDLLVPFAQDEAVDPGE